MKYILFVILFIPLHLFGQKGYSKAGISSEIIVKEALNKMPKTFQVLPNNSTGELDLDERFYYQIRNESGQDPYVPLPVGLLLKEVEYVIRFGEDIYGPFIDKDIPQAIASSRYSRTCRQLLEPVKKEVLDKINSRNITSLTIYLKFKWHSKDSLSKSKSTTDETGKIILDGIQASLYQYIDKDKADNFIINVKRFGLIALVDLSPLSKDGSQLSLDVVSGLFKNISKTSVDYVANLSKPSFQNIMVSVPFLKYEGRRWFHKNFDTEVIFVSDLSETKKIISYGLGIGALGEKDKTLKAGVYWIDKQANWYVGLSIRGLANWLSNYK